MKKIFIIGGIVLAVLLAVLILVPVVFKDALLQKTKSTLSRNLNVNVNFDDFRLSLVSDFPKATLSLKNVLVTGKGIFAGDTLLEIKSLRTKFGIFDLFSPANLTLNELILDNPKLKLLVNSGNNINWDIVPESKKEVTTKGKEKKDNSFGMQLSKIQINNAEVSYIDMTIPMNIGFKDVNMALKGKMYGSDTQLYIEGTSVEFGLTYDSVTYISKTRLDVKSLLDINFDNWNFRFGESELLVNDLPLDVQGTFSMPGDSILFDMKFASRVSDLAGFLKLVPGDFQHYLKDVKADGKVSLSGNFKGLYYNDTYPALDILFKLNNGDIRYANLSENIKNIEAGFSLHKPQGSFNLTTIEISKAHAEIRNNPLDFSLKLGNLLDDIHFEGNLAGKMNFDQIKDAIPMDSMLVSGLLDVNIGVNGSVSAIENKKYELIKTDGIVSLDDFSFITKQLTMPVLISSGKMDFSPEKVNLQNLDIKIGASDMALSGAVTDYYPYLFSDGTLSGNIVLDSHYLNLNELMALQKSPGKKEGEKSKNDKKVKNDTLTVAPNAFTVPENLNLLFNTKINRAYYDRLSITNISGQVTAHNGRLDLSGLNMNLLDGELKLTGFYEKKQPDNPQVDLSLDLIRFDIPTAFQSFALVRNFLPIGAQSKGKFSTTLKLNSRLDNNMNLDMKSLNGSGLFNSYSVEVLNSPVFNKLKTILKEEKLRDMRIDDFTASFTIENGDLLLKPFTTKISGQEATFAGRLNSDNLIDMNISFIINRDAFSDNIENTLGILPGQKNIESIPVGVSIKGLINNPDVRIDLTEAKKMIEEEVKKASKQEIQNTINKVSEGLKKLFK